MQFPTIINLLINSNELIFSLKKINRKKLYPLLVSDLHSQIRVRPSSRVDYPLIVNLFQIFSRTEQDQRRTTLIKKKKKKKKKKTVVNLVIE